MNWLQAIEKGAGVASAFVPNPLIAAGLKFVASFASESHAAAAAAGATVPEFDWAQIAHIIPPKLLSDLLDGKTVTIEINGKGIQQAIEDISKASTAMTTIQNAFTIK